LAAARHAPFCGQASRAARVKRPASGWKVGLLRDGRITNTFFVRFAFFQRIHDDGLDVLKPGAANRLNYERQSR
jgi:hypothetical protein